MPPRLREFWDQVRGSYWFVPTLMTLGAAIAALALTALDAALGDEATSGLAWVYGGGPEGARALLSTVAGSVITVAGTTFSITIAALTLASSQYGPRLLRTFVRDTANQVVLGTFIATFMYCLIVLRTVRGLEDSRVVPHISVTVGVLLAAASIGVLIYFIHHVATSIQADYIIAAVSHDLDAITDRLLPDPIERTGGDKPSRADGLVTEIGTWPICSGESGYLQAIDREHIVRVAAEHGLALHITLCPGDFVAAGGTLAWARPDGVVEDHVCAALADGFIIGEMRSPQQDVRFSVNQLVEIAVRALSPGVNDPFTAMSCVDRIGAGLCRLAGRAMPERFWFDEDGQLRAIVSAVSFGDLVNLAIDPVRHYGRSDPAVMRHLLVTLRRVAEAVQTLEQATAVWRAADRIRRDAESLADDDTRAQLQYQAQAIAAMLSRHLIGGNGAERERGGDGEMKARQPNRR